MGARINTIMQTCFFAISGILPRDEAIAAIKHSIEKTYGKRGEAVVQKNFAAVDQTLAHLFEVSVPTTVTSTTELRDAMSKQAPPFVRAVTAPIYAGFGDDLPVSVMPHDGTFPSATAQWEKRNIALEIPVWDPDTCIQCGKCVMVCPHAVIRGKLYPAQLLEKAPKSFKSAKSRWKEYPDQLYTLQIAQRIVDGTICIEACPRRIRRDQNHGFAVGVGGQG